MIILQIDPWIVKNLQKDQFWDELIIKLADSDVQLDSDQSFSFICRCLFVSNKLEIILKIILTRQYGGV